jgi:hypothetical protein
MPPPVFSLPNEMLLMVSQNLKNNDLISLSLSAKRFTPIAQHALYESMTIIRTVDKAPFSQVLKTLLAQPKLRSIVKSVSFNLQFTGSYKRSSTGYDLSGDIEEACGQLDYNSDDYKRWALRLVDCSEQRCAGVILSLLPNVVKLDIANRNLKHMDLTSAVESRFPPLPQMWLFGARQPMTPQIAGLSKLQELTLAFKSLGFLSWNFLGATDLIIRGFDVHDIPSVRWNRNAPYHLANLKSLTIEVPAHLGYKTSIGQLKPLLQTLFDILRIPTLGRFTVKIYRRRYSPHFLFDFQTLINIVHTAYSSISDLRIHDDVRVIKWPDSNHGLTSAIDFLNLRHLSISFSAFGPNYTKFKHVPEVIPRSIQHIELLNPSKDVIFWLNMLEIARNEYPDLETVTLVSGIDTPDYKSTYRWILQKKMTDFEKLGIRIRVVKG